MICVDPADPRIATEPVLDDEIVGVAMPGLVPVVDGVAEAATLGSRTLLLQESGSNTRRFVLEELPRYGTNWTTVWQLGSAEAVKHCARAGLGIAFFSKHTLAGELRRGELTSFPLAGIARLVGDISVARLAAVPLGPAERRFVQTLVLTTAEQPSAGEIHMVRSGPARHTHAS